MMRLLVGLPTTGPVVEDGLDSVRCTVPVRVGHHWARDWSASAEETRTCASAAAMLWLETSTCAISASSCGSPKASHHLPRAAASRGSAGFQSPASCFAAGSFASLYAAGTSTSGRT
jgi:hypothetical protein